MAKFVCAGLATLDLAYIAQELPERGMKGTASASYVDVGGPVANAAVTAVLLGSSAEVYSVFGTSVFAQLAIASLSKYGVRAIDHAPAFDLPVASVWIDGSAERTILSTDNKRSAVQADATLIDLAGVAAVLLDGHYPQLQVAVAEAAAAAGIPIVLDCGRWRPIFGDLLPLATDVIMTNTFRPPELVGATVAETVVAIREDHAVSLCAASGGAMPIVAATDEGVVQIDVEKVDVVDTNGAGDVLHGAYLHYRYGEAGNVIDALSAAARAASISCTALGARTLG